MFGLGHWEIILILLIVLIVFGAGKLPKVAGELAKGIKSFKEGLKDEKKKTIKKIMFNIGIIELFNHFFLLVLFIKPEEIPKITKNFGLFYRKISRYLLNFKYELDEYDSIEELKKIKLDFDRQKKNN